MPRDLLAAQPRDLLAEAPEPRDLLASPDSPESPPSAPRDLLASEAAERQPEARDLSKGFLQNLSPRDIRRTMRERGAAPSLVRYFMGNTEKEQERQRKLAGMDVDPIDREFGEAMESAYQAGGYESPEFQKIEAAHKEYLKARDNPEFKWSDIRDAFKQDPGGMAAEFVKTVAADPELLLTPLGWGRAATAAANVARGAGAGKALTTAARAAGGTTGTAATGAAVTAPISAAQQLGESGEVDPERLASETALGAGASALAGGAFAGGAAAGRAAARGARRIRAPEAAPEPARSVGAAEAQAITPETTLGQALETTKRGVHELRREAIDLTGGKAITYLDDAAKVSPTAKRLRNLMEYEEFSDVPVGPSFFERTSLKTGELVSRLHRSLEDLRGALVTSRIGKSINDELLKVLRGGKAASEKVMRVGRQVRGLLNDVRDYARAKGLDVGFIENYFPRIYRTGVLRSDGGRRRFINVLRRHGIEATVADDIAAKIVNEDGILVMERGASQRVNPNRPNEPFDPGRFLQAGRAVRHKNLESARKLAHIPDDELSEFLESNVPAVLSRYIERVVRRAEYADMFGAGEGKLNQMVRDIVREAAEAGRPARPAEIQRIYDLADAMQRQYRPIQSSIGRGLNTFVLAYQYLRTLTLATISSLSEPWLVIARGRPRSNVRALTRALDHSVRETVRYVFRKVPKARATEALEDIGLGLDAALTERLTATFGGEATRLTAAFFKVTFLHQWTRFTRVLANEAGKLMVARHLKDLARGVGGRRARQLERELAELGVPKDEGLAWIQRGAKQDDPFFDTVKAAGLRFTNEVIMNPRPTTRPMWFSNPHFHLLSQIKGFQTTFGNTVVKRWWNLLTQRGAYEGVRNAPKLASAGMLMVLTAMLGNEIRETIKYGPEGNPKFDDESTGKKVYRGMERAGFLGVAQFASDAFFAHRFGSPAVAQLAGPTAGQIEGLLRGTGEALEGKPRRLAREAASAIPIANVSPNIRREITDALAGEPESRRRVARRDRR